jgi:hypothetical protein
LFKHLKKSAGLGAIVAAGALAAGAYAFTASNTVPATKAGSGSGNISGYAVSSVSYTNTDNTITGVSFNLDAAAGQVNVQLDSTGGAWYDCGASAGTTPFAVSCTGLSVPAADADSLTVFARQ